MMSVSTRIAVVTPADHVAGPMQGQWTYAEYAAIPDDGNKYEIVDGVLYMVPSPSEEHQYTSAGFVTYLSMNVRFGGLGRVYSEFDVELAPNLIVRPDVIVVLQANRNRITKSKIVGAPDLVVEIASPSTVDYDRHEKQAAYARAGVKEYWLVDPVVHTIELLVLEQGGYRSLGLYQGQAIIPSQVIPGLPVPVQQFFV